MQAFIVLAGRSFVLKIGRFPGAATNQGGPMKWKHVTYVTDFCRVCSVEEFYTLHAERLAAIFNFQARAS